MSKVTGTDTIENALYKVSEGNPGALTALVELTKSGNVGHVLFLDTLGIYGSDVYVLWNDVCGRDVKRMIRILNAVQDGAFSPQILKDACSRQDYSSLEVIRNYETKN